MAKQTLFAILSRSPWWLSIIVAAALFAVMRLFLPDLIALSVALPFAAIGGYAGWRQLRAPSATKVADVLNVLRAMSWEEFSILIEEAFRQEGYTVTTLTGDDVDYEMSRNERVAVVCCKRWKVARTGVAPVRDLFEAGQARNAHEYMKEPNSTGEEKTTAARSPRMPTPRRTGLPGAGPVSLVSVLRRRLNSQIFSVFPSLVVTK